MNTGPAIVRHPTRAQLLAFAESLAKRAAPVSAAVAAHAAACPVCAAEVKAMRQSLAFIQRAEALEPSYELTSQILLQAQQLRQEVQEHPAKPRRISGVVQALACAAGLLMVAGLVFNAALAPADHEPPELHATRVAPAQESSLPSPEKLRKTAEEVKTLAAAVEFASDKEQSALEREHRRAVHALGADIDAALSALERNPGCVRATHIVHANLERQAQTLRSLYVERTL